MGNILTVELNASGIGASGFFCLRLDAGKPREWMERMGDMPRIFLEGSGKYEHVSTRIKHPYYIQGTKMQK